MAAATKKKIKVEAYTLDAGTSSGHITNLKQSILETFDMYGSNTLARYVIFAPKMFYNDWAQIKTSMCGGVRRRVPNLPNRNEDDPPGANVIKLFMAVSWEFL